MVVGALFRFLYFPYANELLFIGLTMLILNYFPLSILYAIVSKRFKTFVSKISIIYIAITLSIAIVGIEFRTLYFLGAEGLILIAKVLFVPALIIALVSKKQMFGLTNNVFIWGIWRLVLVGIPLWLFVFVNK